MLSRLRSHLRHNVVGYLALFFALSGVAYAAGPLKAGDPAGGDLDGTYPNPTIRSGVVGTAKFSSTIPAARVHGQSQAVPDSGSHKLTSVFEDYDTAALHSTTENPTRVTAPVAGIYHLSARVEWQANPTGDRILEFWVNNSPSQNDYDIQPGVTLTQQTQQLFADLKLAAGDYVEVIVAQHSGSSLGAAPISFTMSWVAPG